MKTAVALVVCILLGTLAPLAAQDKKKKEPAKFDAAKLVGKWEYVSAVKNGAKVDEKSLKKQTIEITKEKFTLKGDDLFVMKYELDASKDPVGIKFEMLESPFGPGAKAVGIIELKGDQVRLCYDPMGEKAPKTFEAKEGSKLHSFVLKRAK